MDDFIKAIEIAQKLTEYVKSRPSIKIASLVFLTAFMLFFSTSLPAVSSILSSMNDTIRAWIFFIMLTSGVYSISAIIVNLAEYLYDKKKAEKQKAKEEIWIKQQLTNLGNSERQILKYALNMSGNVWLPAENINVLSLHSQGIIYPITGMTIHRGDFYKGCQCFAYRVSEKIREYVSEKSLLDTTDWQSISQASEMEIYQ